MMINMRSFYVLATAAVLGAGCSGYSGSAAGDVITPADASQTVVLRAENDASQSMELRTLLNGESHFVGTVNANSKTSILLDPTLFPTGLLYVVAIPSDGNGRAVVGPLSAGKGDKINFTISPALDVSRAVVTR
jgi:hypothetical protein